MKLDRFFKNCEGKWVLYQHPNLLLWLWIITQVVGIVIFKRENQAVNSLSNLLLFTWAYQEIFDGESPFRRVLGGVVVVGIAIGLFA